MARNRSWYALAQALAALNRDARKRLVHDAHERTHFLRIALLHHGIGEELDKRAAPLRVYMFVAYAPDWLEAPRLVGQQARFRAVIQIHDKDGRWPLPPALSGLAFEVDRQLGHVRPRAASPANAKHAEPEPASPADLNAEARAGAARLAQHPDIAAMLGEFAARRANSPPE